MIYWITEKLVQITITAFLIILAPYIIFEMIKHNRQDNLKQDDL